MTQKRIKNSNTGFSIKLQLLCFLAVVLLLAIFFTIPSQNSVSDKSIINETKYALEDTTGITKLVLGQQILSQSPTNSSEWLMNNDFVVDEEMIASLWAIMQRIEVKKPVSETIKDEVINSFLLNGINVQVFRGDNQIRNYKVCTHKGETYAMQEESTSPYSIYIPGYYLQIRDIFDIRPYEWQDRTLLATTPNTFRSLSVSYPTNKEESFNLEFTGKTFKMRELAEADTNKIYEYLPYFSQVMGEQYVKNDKLQDSLKNTSPIAVFSLNDIRNEEPQKLEIYTARGKYFVLFKNQLLLFSPQFANIILRTRSDFAKTE
ncbi:hypothetical protein Fleli_0485 [Bernardetia litoralis DSM 6794]|uniref:DUF4340 domain-containing protein n=1 Tax=Bernardetia litoralis (strain ATCC 23117 / DSM 6794 / NBRC 15988 / NCIMB 1366 / Fx l1 / Sio-4) TaxID=880071 RepID=I4AG76_BERLS|nr:hypothetical protein [Bernardetia litoralis]AFM02961.1 hypothetical protein Fleli_0485 [Bernardetia litoralis DSM 6794]